MGTRYSNSSNIKLVRNAKSSETAAITSKESAKVPLWKKFKIEFSDEELENYNSSALDVNTTSSRGPWIRKYNEKRIDEKSITVPGVTDLNVEDLLEIGAKSGVVDIKWLEKYLGANADMGNGSPIYLEDSNPASKRNKAFFNELFKKIKKRIGYASPKSEDDPDYRNNRYLVLPSNIPELQGRYLVDLNWNGPDSYMFKNKKYVLANLEVRLYDKKYDVNIGEIFFDNTPRIGNHRLNLRTEVGPFSKHQGFRQITPFGAALLSGVVSQLYDNLK